MEGENQDDPAVDTTSPPEAEEPPPKEASEKKVGINDEPEVFMMDPETTDVKPVKKPIPCPPPIEQQVLDKIIAESIAIVADNQKQCYVQKLAIQDMAFMLSCVQESLDVYQDHIEKLNAYLVNSERLQAVWFCKFLKGLRCFGDYPLVLKDAPEKIKVDELPFPVKESDLKKLADDAVNNFYAGGTVVRSMRVVCKNVNDKMDYRRDFIEEQCEPFPSWFSLLNVQQDNQDKIIEELFKINATCNFLKTGEINDALVLDISKELEKLEKLEKEEKEEKEEKGEKEEKEEKKEKEEKQEKTEEASTS